MEKKNSVNKKREERKNLNIHLVKISVCVRAGDDFQQLRMWSVTVQQVACARSVIENLARNGRGGVWGGGGGGGEGYGEEVEGEGGHGEEVEGEERVVIWGRRGNGRRKEGLVIW